MTPEQISPEEMTLLLKTFENPDQAYANGLHVNGEKFTVIQVGDNTIRTKKVSYGSISEQGEGSKC